MKYNSPLAGVWRIVIKISEIIVLTMVELNTLHSRTLLGIDFVHKAIETRGSGNKRALTKAASN